VRAVATKSLDRMPREVAASHSVTTPAPAQTQAKPQQRGQWQQARHAEAAYGYPTQPTPPPNPAPGRPLAPPPPTPHPPPRPHPPARPHPAHAAAARAALTANVTTLRPGIPPVVRGRPQGCPGGVRLHSPSGAPLRAVPANHQAQQRRGYGSDEPRKPTC